MLNFFAKVLTKQFIFGRIFFWIKPKLYSLFYLTLILCLTIYLHDQYLSYIEYVQRISIKEFEIKVSYIIKNLVIICSIIGFVIFNINKKINGLKKIENTDQKNTITHTDENLDALLNKEKLIDHFNKDK